MKYHKIFMGLALVMALMLAACSGPTPGQTVPQTGAGGQTITPAQGEPTVSADQAGGGGPGTGSTPGVENTPVKQNTQEGLAAAAPAASACAAAGPGTLLFSQEAAGGAPGYCFLYPDDFQLLAGGTEGSVSLAGPDRGAGPERASLSITALNPAGLDFKAFVEQEVAQAGMGLVFNQQDGTLAGEPAVIIEGLPGQVGSRVVYASHGGFVFYLMFTPLDSALVDAQADMERLYQTALSSWAWQ